MNYTLTKTLFTNKDYLCVHLQRLNNFFILTKATSDAGIGSDDKS